MTFKIFYAFYSLVSSMRYLLSTYKYSLLLVLKIPNFIHIIENVEKIVRVTYFGYLCDFDLLENIISI